MGEFLIRSTAILAVAGYAGRVMIDVADLRQERWQRRARWFWAIGGVTLLLHVICAFHFEHGWSQAVAWEQTRKRTLELTGWNSGIGIYANEVLLIIWLADVIGWGLWLDWPRRNRLWFWVVQVLFAFMMINATAVFGPWYWRPAVAAYGFFVAMITARRTDVDPERQTKKSSM